MNVLYFDGHAGWLSQAEWSNSYPARWTHNETSY